MDVNLPCAQSHSKYLSILKSAAKDEGKKEEKKTVKKEESKKPIAGKGGAQMKVCTYFWWPGYTLYLWNMAIVYLYVAQKWSFQS